MKTLLRKFVILAILSALITPISQYARQDPSEKEVGRSDVAAPVAANTPNTSSADPHERGADLFAKLVEHNAERDRRLDQYTGIRQYELRNDKGDLAARMVVRMEYRAPGTKTFENVSVEGSRWIRKFVFRGLMNSEAEAAAGREHHDSSITPYNYDFRFEREEDMDGYHCFVVYANPKRQDKYLFEGLVWIDSQDYAVVKIVGHPAKNPSVWIKRVDWTRRYGKVGDFWLPTQDETMTVVRILGKKHLLIDYRDYAVNQPPSETGQHTPSPPGKPRADDD
jgi:hypothetical protein